MSGDIKHIKMNFSPARRQLLIMSCKLILIVLFCVYGGALGHGRVMDPMNRGSMWRIDRSAPTNYDDNANFCGGFAIQWGVNKGICGICGDNYRLPQPRPNENTGTYGRGVISRKYKKGSVVKASVEITANHFGHFTFSLCKLNNPNAPEDEKCFTDLKLADGSATYNVTTSRVGFYFVSVKLPEDVTCDRCVFRWQYTAGNNWGVCPNGTGMVGCGPQETFRTCSDIAIV